MYNKDEIINLRKTNELITIDIAQKVGISPESIRAIKTYVTVGTYVGF